MANTRMQAEINQRPLLKICYAIFLDGLVGEAPGLDSKRGDARVSLLAALESLTISLAHRATLKKTFHRILQLA